MWKRWSRFLHRLEMGHLLFRFLFSLTVRDVVRRKWSIHLVLFTPNAFQKYCKHFLSYFNVRFCIGIHIHIKWCKIIWNQRFISCSLNVLIFEINIAFNNRILVFCSAVKSTKLGAPKNHPWWVIKYLTRATHHWTGCQLVLNYKKNS